MKKFILMALAIAAPAAVAQSQFDTITLPNSAFTLTDGQTTTVELPGKEFHYIQKLIIRAEGVGREAAIEVLVNGDDKGTVYAPGRDPSYIVTVAETTSSIQFRQTSGSMHVLEVKAVLSSFSTALPTPPPFVEPVKPTDALRISLRAIQLAEQLRPFVIESDYATFVLPIKKVAGRAYADAIAYSDLSCPVHAAMSALSTQIGYAQAFFDRTLEQDAAFDTVVELIQLNEQIKNSL